MARQRDDREVQIDNSTNGRFCNAFQWLVVITALNVGTLLMGDEFEATEELTIRVEDTAPVKMTCIVKEHDGHQIKPIFKRH